MQPLRESGRTKRRLVLDGDAAEPHVDLLQHNVALSAPRVSGTGSSYETLLVTPRCLVSKSSVPIAVVLLLSESSDATSELYPADAYCDSGLRRYAMRDGGMPSPSEICTAIGPGFRTTEDYNMRLEQM
jgi:hypothetical protein